MEWLNSLTGTAPASTGGAPASADPEESVPDPEESVPASDPTGVLTKHVPSDEQQPTKSHTEKRAPRETLHKAAATTRTGRGDAPKPTCPRQRLVLIGLELAILVLAGAGAGVAVALSSSSSSSGTAATMGQELVSIELIASGAVSDYDDAARSDIAARFASEAGVDTSAVTVSVTAASVRILINITAADAAAATSVIAAVQDDVADAAAASAFLGITVESAPILTTSVSPPSLPPPPTPPPSPRAPVQVCEGDPSTSTCPRTQCTLPSGSPSMFCLSSSPSSGFTCPASKATCDAAVASSSSWPTASDLERIRGASATYVPYYERAVRRSSLDPCELVPAYDEVWSDGICLKDSWAWRPFIDLTHHLLGKQFLFRLYVLELGGPAENYARVECDLKSWTNQHDGTTAWWGHELTRAKDGLGAQIIDNAGWLCSAADHLAASQYSWQHSSSSTLAPTGQCQLYPGARYTTHVNDAGGWQAAGKAVVGQYFFTPQPPKGPPHHSPVGYSDFVHSHELLHLAQNAHRGRRLYMEHGADGECCTLWFEHVSYVAYAGYVAQLSERFAGLQLYPPWNGWRVDEQMEAGFSSGRYPSWMRLTYPSPTSADALEQKWHVATFVQSAYRAYWAIKNDSTTYRNHALVTTACRAMGDSACAPFEDPTTVYASLSDEDKALYSEAAGGTYQIVFDITYRLKNLQTQWFTYKANQVQPNGFGAFEFFTYELQNPRLNWMTDYRVNANGFSGRRQFLEAFHVWMVANLDNQRTPLEVAEEITQPQSELLADIARLKAAHRIDDPEGLLPRCADESMPVIDFKGEGTRRAVRNGGKAVEDMEERLRQGAATARKHVHEFMMREQGLL